MRRSVQTKRNCDNSTRNAHNSLFLFPSMRTTLQRPDPPSAWTAERSSIRHRPSLALQRSQFASKLAQVPRAFGEMPPRSSSLTRTRATPSDNGPASSPSPSSSAQTRVLMVCLGNICRSPAAEAVLAHLVKKRKLGDSVFVDSCGTVSVSVFRFFPSPYAFFRVKLCKRVPLLLLPATKTRNESRAHSPLVR